MSIKLMNACYERELSAKLQRVLIVLCDFANDNGDCWPSLGLMAWKLGLNERTIRRAVEDLEAIGVLAVVHRLGQSSLFHIDLTQLPEKPPYQTRNDGQNVHASSLEAMDKMSGVNTATTGQNVQGQPAGTPDILSVTPDKMSTNPGHFVHQPRTKCPPEPPIEPSKNHQEEPSDRSASKPTALDVRFDRFWAVYPRKVGKTDARKAWDKLKPSEPLTEQMIAAVRAWSMSPEWQKNDGQYIPHPTTWLHGERWLDELPPPRAPNGQAASNGLSPFGQRIKANTAAAKRLLGIVDEFPASDVIEGQARVR